MMILERKVFTHFDVIIKNGTGYPYYQIFGCGMMISDRIRYIDKHVISPLQSPLAKQKLGIGCLTPLLLGQFEH